MVTVKIDERAWKVNFTVDKENCPFVFYPINIHACNHPSVNNTMNFLECTLENCPFKVKEKSPMKPEFTVGTKIIAYGLDIVLVGTIKESNEIRKSYVLDTGDVILFCNVGTNIVEYSKELFDKITEEAKQSQRELITPEGYPIIEGRIVRRKLCMHETHGTTIEITLAMYYPLPLEELEILMEKAVFAKQRGDFYTFSDIQSRICQSIPGFVCPNKITGPVAKLDHKISARFQQINKDNWKEMTYLFYELVKPTDVKE